MVSTRRGEYTTPEKAPPIPLPPPDEDDDNNNGGEGVAVGLSLNFDDDSSSVDDKESVDNEDVDYHNNYDHNDDNDDDKEEEAAPRNSKRRHGMMEEEGGGGGGEDEDSNEGALDEECVWLDQKSKSKMSDIELCNYYNTKLQKMGATSCSNPQCNCLAILRDGRARSSVARYLAWISRREKQERDMIVFEWYRYNSINLDKL